MTPLMTMRTGLIPTGSAILPLDRTGVGEWVTHAKERYWNLRPNIAGLRLIDLVRVGRERDHGS